MRFLVVDTYYPPFLEAHYRDRPGLARQPYEVQRDGLLGRCFGTSDYYARNLRALGHEAEEVIANSLPLQRAWARENGLPSLPTAGKRTLLRILAAQIEKIRPDVLYVQDLNWIDAGLLHEVRARVPAIVGQTSYALSPDVDLGPYDRLLTSFPHYVSMLRRRGLPAAFLPLAFEPAVLEKVGSRERVHGAVFVGGYAGPQHEPGARFLEEVAARVKVDFWGYGEESLRADYPIRRRFHGPAWGLDMYRVLADAKIAVNRHGPVAGRFCNNMRLFEATGMGCALVTDRKDNLADLFRPDEEVVAYDSAADCAERIAWLLGHERERAALAAAGQRRTLTDHTYAKRMEAVADHAAGIVRGPRAAAGGPRRLGRPVSRGPVRAALRRARPIVEELPGGRLAIATAALALRTRARLRGPSDGYLLFEPGRDPRSLDRSWQDPSIPEQQRAVVEDELLEMYRGHDVPVLRTAAEAVRATGCEAGSILEVGCASGYYQEVLEYYAGRRPDYLGVDYSLPLLRMALRANPGTPFAAADATSLPFADGAFELVISGCVLLHLADYDRAIAETARVARVAAIFHRTPVMRTAPTMWLRKRAYGVEMAEVVFEESHLLEQFRHHGLETVEKREIQTHAIACLPEPVTVTTYVCRKGGS